MPLLHNLFSIWSDPTRLKKKKGNNILSLRLLIFTLIFITQVFIEKGQRKNAIYINNTYHTSHILKKKNTFNHMFDGGYVPYVNSINHHEYWSRPLSLWVCSTYFSTIYIYIDSNNAKQQLTTIIITVNPASLWSCNQSIIQSTQTLSDKAYHN